MYDFETDTHTNIHKPNLCEVSVLNVSDDHEYDKSFEKSESFEGYECLDNFGDWLFQKENTNSTVFAHNQAGYDGTFILVWCLTNILVPSKYIQQGNRISYKYVAKNKNYDLSTV